MALDNDINPPRPATKQEAIQTMSMLASESRGPSELVSILRKKTVRRNAGVRGQSKNPNQAAKSRPQQQQQQASTTGHISDRHQPDQSSSSQPKKVQKPRRRVATIAQRRAANIRERRRMFNLNAAFDRLRKKVPSFAYEKRLSRIETLKLAIMYIRFMDDLVHDDAYAEKYKQLIANSSQGTSTSLAQNSSAFFSTPPNNHTYMPLYTGQHCPPPAPPTPPSESGSKRSLFQGQTLMVDAVQKGNQMDCHNEECCPQQQQRQYRQMISGSSPINGLCCGLASPPSLYSSSSSSVSHSSCHSTSPASSTTFTDSSSLSPVAAAGKPISLLFDNYHRQHQTCIPAGPPSQQQQPAQYPHGYEQFQDNISISTYYNCEPAPTKYYNELNCYEQKLAPMSCYPASKQCQQSGQISDLSQAHSNQLEQQHRGSSPLPAALPLRPLSPLETTRSSVGVNGSYSLQSLEAR